MNETNHNKTYKPFKLIIISIKLLLLVSCGALKVGRDFNISRFESVIKVGETTKEQILSKIGSPKSQGVSLNRDGERLIEWVYFYATGKVSDMDEAKLKILQIRFDQRGILRSYNWSSSY